MYPARGAMEVGKSPVIIDNTNTNTWEMKPYIHLVRTYFWSVRIEVVGVCMGGWVGSGGVGGRETT